MLTKKHTSISKMLNCLSKKNYAAPKFLYTHVTTVSESELNLAIFNQYMKKKTNIREQLSEMLRKMCAETCPKSKQQNLQSVKLHVYEHCDSVLIDVNRIHSNNI